MEYSQLLPIEYPLEVNHPNMKNEIKDILKQAEQQIQACQTPMDIQQALREIQKEISKMNVKASINKRLDTKHNRYRNLQKLDKAQVQLLEERGVVISPEDCKSWDLDNQYDRLRKKTEIQEQYILLNPRSD